MTAYALLHDLTCDGPPDCTCTPHRVIVEGDAAHWTCPDCGQPCTCSDPISRIAIHRRCGVSP